MRVQVPADGDERVGVRLGPRVDPRPQARCELCHRAAAGAGSAISTPAV
jgi:hypothetical protein